MISIRELQEVTPASIKIIVVQSNGVKVKPQEYDQVLSGVSLDVHKVEQIVFTTDNSINVAIIGGTGCLTQGFKRDRRQL